MNMDVFMMAMVIACFGTIGLFLAYLGFLWLLKKSRSLLLSIAKFLFGILSWLLGHFQLPIPLLYSYVNDLHAEIVEMEKEAAR